MNKLPVAYIAGSWAVTLSPFPRGSMLDRIWCHYMVTLYGAEAQARFAQATGLKVRSEREPYRYWG